MKEVKIINRKNKDGRRIFSINKDYNLENLVKYKLKDDDIILIHDGANSLITKELINELIEATEKYGAAVTGVRGINTIKEVDEDGFVIGTLDRREFWEMRYPRTMRYGLLKLCKGDFYRIDLLEDINIKVIEIKYNLDI